MIGEDVELRRALAFIERASSAVIALPELGTNAMPLFVSVRFSQACTVEVRSSDKYPVLVTETALNSFVPKAGALLYVILPSDQELLT